MLRTETACYRVEEFCIDANRVCEERYEQCCPGTACLHVHDDIANGRSGGVITQQTMRDVTRQYVTVVPSGSFFQALEVGLKSIEELTRVGRSAYNGRGTSVVVLGDGCDGQR